MFSKFSATTVKESGNAMKNALPPHYIEITTFGDGNCGANAYAFAIIDLILQDQFKLSQENYARFYRAILNSRALLMERIKLYRGEPSKVVGHAYPDIADSLIEITANFQSIPTLSFDEFKNYVKNYCHDQASIAAMQVALAPAIRAIAVESVARRINFNPDARDPLRQEELNEMKDDGVDLLEDYLRIAACDFFRMNLHVLKIEKSNADESVLRSTGFADDPQPDAPEIYFLNRGDRVFHWNYLVPVENENIGIARYLPSSTEISVDVQPDDEFSPEIISEQDEDALCDYESIPEIETNPVLSPEEKNLRLQEFTQNTFTLFTKWKTGEQEKSKWDEKIHQVIEIVDQHSENAVPYLFPGDLRPVFVDQATQIELDEELAKKLQEEECEEYFASQRRSKL